MFPLIAKALLLGALIVAIAEIGKRQPVLAALAASLPPVLVLGTVLLWWRRPDTENMAQHAQATFWHVLPSLPIFLIIPPLLWNSASFWPSLLAGCTLTVLLSLAMMATGPRCGLRL